MNSRFASLMFSSCWFARRHVACTASLCEGSCASALVDEEMLEMEEERELLDEVSEIIDSGEESTDVVFAREDRRRGFEYASCEGVAARH